MGNKFPYKPYCTICCIQLKRVFSAVLSSADPDNCHFRDTGEPGRFPQGFTVRNPQSTDEFVFLHVGPPAPVLPLFFCLADTLSLTATPVFIRFCRINGKGAAEVGLSVFQATNR
ncbi:Uncharacterised protein [Serratia marcescens]|nr:Uncharacterised protein [Serratia marcescens]